MLKDRENAFLVLSESRSVNMKINLQNADKMFLLLAVALLVTMVELEQDSIGLGKALASALELVAAEIPHV